MVCMVGNGNDTIAGHFRPPSQFSRDKNSITENGMGMKINHGVSPEYLDSS